MITMSDLLPVGEVNVGATERAVTAGVGGAALLAALSRPGPTGWLLGLAGGLMLARAATGHCPAYRAMGMSTADAAADARWPSGRRDDVAEVLDGPHREMAIWGGDGHGEDESGPDEVTRDSEQSFPASDPPGWRTDRVG